MKTDAFAKKIGALAKEGDARFLEIGKLLRSYYEELSGQDEKGEVLKALLKGTKISRRRAFYWMEVDKVFGEFDIPAQRLVDIGWTKLSLIAKQIDAGNLEAWLKLAENNTADGLRALLNDQEPPEHILRFKLTSQQYAVIAGTLMANGAYMVSGAGLANKEKALLKVCRIVRKAWDAGII